MCVLRPCSVFLDVLCLFYLNTCVFVCHSFHGPLRECLRARRFQATLFIAPPSVYVSDVIGALACGFQTQTKTKSSQRKRRGPVEQAK